MRLCDQCFPIVAVSAWEAFMSRHPETTLTVNEYEINPEDKSVTVTYTATAKTYGAVPCLTSEQPQQYCPSCGKQLAP